MGKCGCVRRLVVVGVPTSELPHHGFTPGMDPEVAKPAPLVAATTSTAALSPARRLAETALPRGRTSAIPAWSRWFRTARAPFLFAWGRALRHPRTGMARRLWRGGQPAKSACLAMATAAVYAFCGSTSARATLHTGTLTPLQAHQERIPFALRSRFTPREAHRGHTSSHTRTSEQSPEARW